MPHKQYNTSCAILLLLNTVRGKIWHSANELETQRKPAVHLLLEEAVRWEHGIFLMPVAGAIQLSQGAHRSGTETDL